MATDSIALRLINQSADLNNSSILIYQKNVATNFDGLAVAWHVIENLGTGRVHPFQYDLGLQVSASDSWGNFVPQMDSADGQLWTVNRDGSGDQLKLTGPANSASEVQVLNGLDRRLYLPLGQAARDQDQRRPGPEGAPRTGMTG